MGGASTAGPEPLRFVERGRLPVHGAQEEGAFPDTGRVGLMDFEFEGPVIEWRGPAPFFFVAIPEEESADIKFAAKGMECGGQVPVRVRIKGTEFTTALFPKDGRYLLPVKDMVRKSAGIEVGQLVIVTMRVGRRRGTASAFSRQR